MKLKRILEQEAQNGNKDTNTLINWNKYDTDAKVGATFTRYLWTKIGVSPATTTLKTLVSKYKQVTRDFLAKLPIQEHFESKGYKREDIRIKRFQESLNISDDDFVDGIFADKTGYAFIVQVLIPNAEKAIEKDPKKADTTIETLAKWFDSTEATNTRHEPVEKRQIDTTKRQQEPVKF